MPTPGQKIPIAPHAGPVQPEFLPMHSCGILRVTEKQRVFKENHITWLIAQAGVCGEKLIGQDERGRRQWGVRFLVFVLG